MPIYLRRFTLSKIKEHFDTVNKANNPEKPGSQTLVDSSGKITPNQVKNANSKYK